MRYLLILFIFLSNSAFCQELIIHRTIQWNSSREAYEKKGSENLLPGKSKYLHFKNAVYKNSETLFPFYNELIPIPDYYHYPEINIRDIEYKPLTSDELRSIIFPNELPSEFTLNTYQTFGRGIPSVSLSLLPLRRNPGTNIIEKMTSFSIEVIPGNEPAGIPDVGKTTIHTFQENSVLSSGEWFKVSIKKSGIYKLTYTDLTELGISNPENIRIYGNGGKALPLMNRDPRPGDLTENAIYMEKGTDGIFNTGDYILFYGQGVVTWELNQSLNLFQHVINDFSDYTYYFLTSSFGPGKRIESIPAVTEPADTILTSFDDYDYHEKNLYNLIQSGQQWLGEKFDYTTIFDTTFSFPNLNTTYPVILVANVASRSSETKYFNISINDQYSEYIGVSSVDITANTGTYARQNSELFQLSGNGDNITVKITYNKDENSDEGWLDYLTINARRQLEMTSRPLFFRDAQSVRQGRIAEFRILNTDAQTIIWDISDINNVRLVETSDYGGGMAFKAYADELKEYVAFKKNMEFPSPLIDKNNMQVENQNLHGTAPHKMLIVTHPMFLNQAEKLAEFHRMQDGYSVFVTTTDKVYNEFSSGMPDISAIRDFTRMLYNRSGEDENALKYLLLFGDGSYNNISKKEGNPNFVPTYQSVNSMTYTLSYVSDDFYGFLDLNEGGSDSMSYYLLDIGVGRLPVGDTTEAKHAVDKILAYNSSQAMQDWRNTLLFVGDDQDGNQHMEQANSLADYIRTNYPEFVVKKVLLDAYKQVTSANGNHYPDVNQAILDNFNKGILIFNYSGHGSENGIAEEQILLKQDIEKLNNKGKYPLFITATCEFSRWDNMIIDEKGNYKEQSSAGEAALLNANGGAIALLSTTRVVFAPSNHYLSQNFYYKAFLRDEKGQRHRMGEVVRLAKNAVGQNRNKLSFTLLGDPALQLAYPEYKVITDSINGTNISGSLDTVKAFREITVSGHLADQENNLMENFNGTAYPLVFDKVQTIKTLSNDDPEQTPLEFSVQENLLFKGRASVTNGRFKFSFIVPKDISYTIGKGKINYYAQNGNVDAHGYFSEFLIGGTSDLLVGDFTGPEIELYLNDENFRDGGITDKDPVIYARIWDQNGINTTGNGIGHDIIGILDGNTNGPIVLNDYYQTRHDSYQGGEVIYQMNDLSPGYHTLSVKIWDVFNNSSERLINFKVIDSDELILEEVYNFPNPLTENTYFQFEHNMPDQDLTIRIDIFDFSGRLICSIHRESYSGGYRSEPIEWDGRDMNGNKMPRGIYPYRIAVETVEGHYAAQFQKLMILN